jgi:hypothetical protein
MAFASGAALLYLSLQNMGAKASAWLNSVLIDNAQIAPIHVIGIVITGK